MKHTGKISIGGKLLFEGEIDLKIDSCEKIDIAGVDFTELRRVASLVDPKMEQEAAPFLAAIEEL